MTPGQLARQQIDALLTACGWTIQDYNRVDFGAAFGIALRDAPISSNCADYQIADRQQRRESGNANSFAGDESLKRDKAHLAPSGSKTRRWKTR